MKKLLIFLGMAGMMMACNDNNNEDIVNNRTDLNTQDSTFVHKAALANETEIRFGAAAAAYGYTHLVREYGRWMVDQHQYFQNDLDNSFFHYDNVGWPDSIDSEHQQMLDQLVNMNGYAFDSMYIATQITDHQKAETLYQDEKTNGKETLLMNYASQYLPNIQNHLQTADSIQEDLKSNFPGNQ